MLSPFLYFHSVLGTLNVFVLNKIVCGWLWTIPVSMFVSVIFYMMLIPSYHHYHDNTTTTGRNFTNDTKVLWCT